MLLSVLGLGLLAFLSSSRKEKALPPGAGGGLVVAPDVSAQLKGGLRKTQAAAPKDGKNVETSQ